MKEQIKTIESAVSSDRLLNIVERFTQHHRIQASQGHRDAIAFLDRYLKERGVSARILSYPADYGIDYLGYYLFQEWNCRSAFLRLASPVEMELADFAGCPASIIQKSGPCDYSREPVDIVYLDRGSDEAAYPDVDLKGKIIFLREDFKAYVGWAVEKRGAVGIISDFSDEGRGTPEWLALAPVSQYRSFWYYSMPTSTPFGFSITACNGEKLAELCLKMRKEHSADPTKPQYPQAFCKVDAEFSKGHVEVLEAEIPGQTEEEVWLTAHSCHPRHCANDNASGVAAATEAISVLHRLIEDGRLPKPKRTIKALLMPEFTGTYPYLANDANVDKCVGALNMDMVGGKQSLGYGPLNLVGLPYSTPSIVADLCGVVLGELKKEVPALSPGTFLPMFNSQRIPYSGGSDHLILSDPTMGIPAPMLLQWPDIFYHTGGDTLDKICPHLIKKSSSLAAGYAYCLATLTPEDLPEIFRESFAEFVRAANAAVDSHKEGSELTLAQKLRFVFEFYDKAAESSLALFTQEEQPRAQETISRQRSLLRTTFDALCGEAGPEAGAAGQKKDLHVPRRTLRAVVIRTEHYTRTEEQKAARAAFQAKWSGKMKNGGAVQYLSQYYINGERSIDDIASRVLYETCGDYKEAIVDYIYLLRELKLCDF